MGFDDEFFILIPLLQLFPGDDVVCSGNLNHPYLPKRFAFERRPEISEFIDVSELLISVDQAPEHVPKRHPISDFTAKTR